MADHYALPLTDFVEYPADEMHARSLAFLQQMQRRHSVRHFSDWPVSQDVIDHCVAAAGTAPNGANHQPWHFCAIQDQALKSRLRVAAEAEERAFYGGRASDAWLQALTPLGTDAQKPFLETAPWLIAVFAQRRGGPKGDEALKNYYISESVGIATGILITALHNAGLATLTHTPAPMSFLTEICERPRDEKPFILLVVGYPGDGATVPAHALEKKPLDRIRTIL